MYRQNVQQISTNVATCHLFSMQKSSSVTHSKFSGQMNNNQWLKFVCEAFCVVVVKTINKWMHCVYSGNKRYVEVLDNIFICACDLLTELAECSYSR